MQIITLLLTCANEKEADKITDTLLKKHLVVCVKKAKVASLFLWKGELDKADEVLLIMDSEESKFKKIEKEVRKIHSYKQFVLISLPVIGASRGVQNWIKRELH